ncbi:hypothetical protein [Demequina flava]|uniref:hypothetical protein n=1 Tax=Demequina flava TaxID=1095025 RepID=UPI000AAEED13|nr:hypothetical protein [Demequina flava]
MSSVGFLVGLFLSPFVFYAVMSGFVVRRRGSGDQAGPSRPVGKTPPPDEGDIRRYYE